MFEISDVVSDFVSEVGFFTGNWPEGDLFVVFQKDVISTERPVKDKVNITVVKKAKIICLIDQFSEIYYPFFKINQYVLYTSPCVPDV